MPSYQRIKQRREAVGLSLFELAELMRPNWPGITKGTLSKIENNHRTVKADELPLFAKALDCRLEDLVDEIL
jgi:transcriptional regulator with XRE-family HTH domain